MKNGSGEIYRANWIDGCIYKWNDEKQNWIRNKNMIVMLEILNDPKNIKLEFMNKINRFYGITQNPKTNNYMMVLNDKCKKCNYTCNAIHFQQNFVDWTSGNDYIDKFIQDSQLSVHKNAEATLEWIPYDRLYDIKYITKVGFCGIYRANWIDGYICNWNDKNKNWKRDSNIVVILKVLNNQFILWNNSKSRKKDYMMVLNEKNCKKCSNACNAIHFQYNFINWTSGNDDIDKFIQDTQLLVHDNYKVFKKALEWISYDRLYDIKYIAKVRFGKIYRANWVDGYIDEWKVDNQSWKRNNKNMVVALKSLNNSKDVTLKFMNEILSHNKGKIDNNFIVGFYGITQDPKTKDYMMVLDYAEDGSLRDHLDKNYNILNWNKKISYLQDAIIGIRYIHKKELFHRDLHIGNILKLECNVVITDMGLCRPANCDASENSIYGNLPYIAPEILRGKNYTKASDIYSFGIIMYEVISGLRPYHDYISHDENLAIKICKGLRPRFNIKVPQLIVQLIKICLDSDPLKRPKAEEIEIILYTWLYEQNDEQIVVLQTQIDEADDINSNSPNISTPSTNIGLLTYESRLLDFNSLPEPKNSDDYYEQNDDIISKEFSGIN
ncbi:Tpk1p [Rhizophagus irregularis DAOM 197198w]|uniref:Tpk1p n=1 Tax=Rhizophagus irregularis (strain DAOM 197198w) TaxID=1432141 RepID=A0A015I9S2_RHIIW|nr:Tpk1p [Rhizophagus irregularis DAOM 197198w]